MTKDQKDLEIDNLTPEEELVYEQALVRQRLLSKEALGNWCKNYLGVDLADCTVSRFSTSNPLDMVWDIYQFCADEVNQTPKSIRYIAGRSSQKTLSTAVLQVLLPLHFKRGVVHFGGTVTQAKRAYSYFKKFVTKPMIRPFLQGEPTQVKTIFVVDGEDIEVEVLSVTAMAVQGSHQPVVSLDELASMSPDKIKAYDDISGIPIFTNDGKPPITFGISSRKGKYTVIETEYEERERTGIEFKFWTIFENTKRCPDEISGEIPTDLYVNTQKNQALTTEEFRSLPPETASEFEKVEAGNKCRQCPMAAFCGGDLKRQTSTCKTLRPARAAIEQFKQSPSIEWWASQAMSMQPSAEGLIYSRFDKQVFEKTPREMYTMFFGKDPGLEITEDQLIKEMIDAGVKRFAGIDHGTTAPFVVVVAYEDSIGNVYIMKVHAESGLDPVQCVEIVRRLKNKYKFTLAYPDLASPGTNKMIAKVVRIFEKYKKSIDDGIVAIRSKIAPITGGTNLYGIKGNCDPLISNFEKYHYSIDTAGELTDTPVDANNDCTDALSYIAQNRWNRHRSLLSPNVEDRNKPEDPAVYAEKVKDQYDNWMTQEINKSTAENVTGDGTIKKSNSGGFFWDV